MPVILLFVLLLDLVGSQNPNKTSRYAEQKHTLKNHNCQHKMGKRIITSHLHSHLQFQELSVPIFTHKTPKP
jgi:hypothetical protein